MMQFDDHPHVLVMEDEPLIAMGLRMVLEGMGCEVCAVVDNAADAVTEALSAKSLDLLLADVRLRGGDDGIAAVRMILAQRNVAVLFVTGNAGEVERSGLEAHPLLHKPFLPAALERAVRSALEGAQKSRSA